ncbi:MAG: hypothetical protein N3G76_00760 [Candidatus Micrarchaeota archaeon]|nr:hypothetical protein [Candidatus Micrarchaeota archaeon]
MAGILYPFGELDVLLYYSKVAGKLTSFLDKKELAGKILFPGNPRPLLTRGTKLEPLYVTELAKNVDEPFLKLRSGHHLDEVKDKLTPLQQKIWRYFPPRKLADFFYATNTEKGKEIDRIFFDIDRGEGVDAQAAQEVAYNLICAIKDDKDFASICKYDIYTQYTGSSFHVYIMLQNPEPASFYNEHFTYGRPGKPPTLTEKWVKSARAQSRVNVIAGHEKVKGAVIIDPSQTPPGKLARAPFSLHMRDPKTVDGIAIPLTGKLLEQEGLIDELSSYTPEKVIKELGVLSKRIP